jgi:hypothetical protein
LGSLTGGHRFKHGSRRPGALNLFVRAYNVSGKHIAESATVFAAPATVQINFTTAADGVVRSPSIFTTISASVATQLQDTPLGDLKEDKNTHELQFLSNSISFSFDDVAYLFMGHTLGAKSRSR